MKFSVNKNHWGKVNESLNVSSRPYIVGGFVKSVGKGRPPKFISIGILPINKYGVPIESSFERKLYDILCENKRLVQRPIDTKFYPLWNGLLPDGLLKDTEIPTIIEVFGMRRVTLNTTFIDNLNLNILRA
ncbi:hypothetical protein [Bacillus sp. V2I10]|uniref:hypothetical protein n=1 Tax=Bacillus sp. V2I10 TaxID=3042276 RepID=UPI002781CDA5|nr:hypothetical protein [Bacillus sp. V2I10]MDQ0862076.1 hypothetical protein [Bacillus sp. V2I10]